MTLTSANVVPLRSAPRQGLGRCLDNILYSVLPYLPYHLIFAVPNVLITSMYTHE